MVLNRAQAPTKWMLVDQKGLGKPPVFSGREEDFYVWSTKVENYVSGVFPNVCGALSFAVESRVRGGFLQRQGSTALIEQNVKFCPGLSSPAVRGADRGS